MKRYYLGLAAGYSGREVWRHLLEVTSRNDIWELEKYLGRRYGGEAIACKNGRSALALALKAYFEPGDAVIVNAFTCYAVYEAVRAAGLVPVWVDINREDLNYDRSALEKSAGPDIRGIIVQNTLGNPIDIAYIEKLASKHNWTIIEDLAHSAGVKYPDGREVGTVGAGVALSFGKEKAVDAVSGGALVLRDPCKHQIKAPTELPKLADRTRARFYPLWGALCRGLGRVHLGGALMRCLLKLRWVERSADNKLDLSRMIGPLEARMALIRLKAAKNHPVRDFALVKDRDKVLEEWKQAGYYFDGFWYERPVSPKRYYRRVHFPEEDCPNAVFVSEHIVNLPSYYGRADLAQARRIVKEHLTEESV